MALYHDSANVTASSYFVTILLPKLTFELDTLHSSYVVELFSKI